MEHIMLLAQGKVYPSWDESKMGVASKLILKAINITTGIPAKEVEISWKKLGDLGEVAKELVSKKKQATLASHDLTVKKVFENIRKLSGTEGKGSVDRKMKLIAELMTSATPGEAKYIVRTVLEDLRIGVGEGSIRDAIVWAYFSKELHLKFDEKENKVTFPEKDRKQYNEIVNIVQRAYDLTNDFPKVAVVAKEHGLIGLQKISLAEGDPIKVMLFKKAKNMEDAFETVGKPAAVEFKYDGFRMQIHKNKKGIVIFTRRLERVTKQFPEIVKLVETHVKGKSFIIDCEAVGYDVKTKKYLPFQMISQRIRRKYDIEAVAKKYPVELNVFDIISFEGKSMLKEQFKKRRELVERIVKPLVRKIVPAKNIITSDLKEADKFYKESLKAGNEGVMFKNLEAIYKPGSRVGYGVKVKPVMEPLDLVIVGAEWGTGKRAGWLTSLTLACVGDHDQFLTIGKVGTGMKEKEQEGVTFGQLTKLLKPLIVHEKGRFATIKPKLVVEINYEEIQKSPTYTSGFALRFPRVIRIRHDRSAKEASDKELVEDLYYGQKK